MFPSTVDRVPNNTAESINQWIRHTTEQNVAEHAPGGRHAISQRLSELDNEWDIERLLEANAATVCLIGVALGALVDKRFFYLPAVVGTFLLQHALQGWCPPVPVFRRLGVRTQSEIDQESTPSRRCAAISSMSIPATSASSKPARRCAPPNSGRLR